MSSAAMDFLLEVKRIPDPKKRLDMFEESDLRNEAEIVAAKAWWDARYHFVNKRKTRVADRFVWFLLSLKCWVDMPRGNGKQVEDAYREAFCSAMFEKAMELSDRLEEEMIHASVDYIETLNPNPGVLGFALKSISKDETMRRICDCVATKLIPGVYTLCGHLEHADVVARCLWKGADEVYPGINALIEAEVKKFNDDRMRSFVMGDVCS